MRDIWHFLGWFALFFSLLSLRSIAVAPEGETSYDSSSIYNQEESLIVSTDALSDSGSTLWEPILGAAPETDTPTVALPAPEVKESSEPLSTVTTFVRPDGVFAPRSLRESLRINYESDAFSGKISPLSLVYDGDRVEPRGQVSGRTLTMSLHIPTVDESLAVFIHELGHIVDIQHLRKGTLSADPSKSFYALSWQSSSEKIPSATIADFVSGYALSNQYEDFAETFAFYVLHNETFRKRAESNESLRRKYEFMRDEVFSEEAFEGTDFGTETVAAYFWDGTKLPFDRKKYLFFIR